MTSYQYFITIDLRNLWFISVTEKNQLRKIIADNEIILHVLSCFLHDSLMKFTLFSRSFGKKGVFFQWSSDEIYVFDDNVTEMCFSHDPGTKFTFHTDLLTKLVFLLWSFGRNLFFVMYWRNSMFFCNPHRNLHFLWSFDRMFSQNCSTKFVFFPPRCFSEIPIFTAILW